MMDRTAKTADVLDRRADLVREKKIFNKSMAKKQGQSLKQYLHNKKEGFLLTAADNEHKHESLGPEHTIESRMSKNHLLGVTSNQ